MKGPTPVTLAEFARALNMPKSTVSRFLSTLEYIGFVTREKDGGKFYLGLRLFELGCKAIDDVGLRKKAIPEMSRLCSKINEDVLLTVIEGTRITYLDKIGSAQAVVTQERVGSTAPAYCVSSGKVMIAYDEDRLEQVIKSGLKAFTPLTIVDPDKLRRECEKIRKRGYAINRSEYRIGAAGIAAPIFGANGTVVGAISTAAPAARMTKRRWREHVDEVTMSAISISRNLGYLEKGRAANALPGK